MKRLILGSTGFVGSNYISFLKSKCLNYNGLARSTDSDFLYKSCNQAYLNQFDAVINFVGKAHDTNGTIDIQPYKESNVNYLIKSYEAFLKSETRIYIYLSSVKAVADNVDGYLTEDHIPNPQTIYGKTKLEAEDYIMSNLPVDKSVFILRPCMIHGPNNKGNLNLLYSLVTKGVPWPLASFENARSFLFIENLIFIINQLIDHHQKVESGIYNVADDEYLSTNQIIELVASETGRKARIFQIPVSVINLIARIGNILPIPLNEERLKKLSESYLVSNTKIKKALGIERMPVSARDGMIKTLQHFDIS